MNANKLAWICTALLAATLAPTPAAANGIDGDCRGVDLYGYYLESPAPDTGVMRLACVTASGECTQDDVGEVCRVGAGVVSTVGSGFCHRPLGPLPPLAAAVCGGALDTAGAILAFTGCSRTVPIGDQQVVPGAFARVRQTDDGALVFQAVVDCGQLDHQCTVKLLPDGRTMQECS